LIKEPKRTYTIDSSFVIGEKCSTLAYLDFAYAVGVDQYVLFDELRYKDIWTLKQCIVRLMNFSKNGVPSSKKLHSRLLHLFSLQHMDLRWYHPVLCIITNYHPKHLFCWIRIFHLGFSVLHDRKYEMFRSTLNNIENWGRFNYRMDWAVVDSVIFFLFLQVIFKDIMINIKHSVNFNLSLAMMKILDTDKRLSIF
jgi:hypothetical protein